MKISNYIKWNYKTNNYALKSKFEIQNSKWKPIGSTFFEVNLAMLLLHLLYIRIKRRWGGVIVNQAPMLQEEEDLVKKRDIAHEWHERRGRQ